MIKAGVAVYKYMYQERKSLHVLINPITSENVFVIQWIG